MKKKIVTVLALLVLFLTNTVFAALQQEDFTLQKLEERQKSSLIGVNLVTSTLADITGYMGEPKKKTEDSSEDPVIDMAYSNLHLSIYSQSNKMIALRFDGREYQTLRGIKVGATSYKVIKEYGQPDKQMIKGHIYYIYKWEQDPKYRLVFDLSDGYVSRVIYTTLPYLP